MCAIDFFELWLMFSVCVCVHTIFNNTSSQKYPCECRAMSQCVRVPLSPQQINCRRARESNRYWYWLPAFIAWNSNFPNYSHKFFAGMGRSLLSLCGDATVFVGFLAITTIYPLWNDIAGRKGKHTKASYIFATGRVSMVPMMFSIARGTLSVRAILGKTNPTIHLIVWIVVQYHTRFKLHTFCIWRTINKNPKIDLIYDSIYKMSTNHYLFLHLYAVWRYYISGYPSEQFYRGAALWETVYGFISAYPLVCFVFVPVYCNLGLTSVYQYLDLRYTDWVWAHSTICIRAPNAAYCMANKIGKHMVWEHGKR